MGFFDRIAESLLPHRPEWERRADWYERAPVGAVSVRAYAAEMQATMEHDIAESARFGCEAEHVDSLEGDLSREPGGMLKGRISLNFGAPKASGMTVMRFTRRSEIQPIPDASASSD